jgi:hypothetical protein
MMRRMFFILGLVSSLAIGSYAQARRTVTNADLEGYRQRRVAAEQDLEQNYARLGFGSPEEMARQRMVSEQQLLELSSRLKQERLERERIELEREQMMLMMNPPSTPYGNNDMVPPGEWFYPTVWATGGGRGPFGRRIRGVQKGYFAGGQFWPEGPRVAPRSFIAQPRSAHAPPPAFSRH